MGYRNLGDCVRDLERTGQLVRIESEIDPHLEAAEIQRRVYQAGGPAVFYARVQRLPVSDGQQSVRHAKSAPDSCFATLWRRFADSSNSKSIRRWH